MNAVFTQKYIRTIQFVTWYTNKTKFNVLLHKFYYCLYLYISK